MPGRSRPRWGARSCTLCAVLRSACTARCRGVWVARERRCGAGESSEAAMLRGGPPASPLPRPGSSCAVRGRGPGRGGRSGGIGNVYAAEATLCPRSTDIIYMMMIYNNHCCCSPKLSFHGLPVSARPAQAAQRPSSPHRRSPPQRREHQHPAGMAACQVAAAAAAVAATHLRVAAALPKGPQAPGAPPCPRAATPSQPRPRRRPLLQAPQGAVWDCQWARRPCFLP